MTDVGLRLRSLVGAVLALWLISGLACFPSEPQTYYAEVTSEPFFIDRVYVSMQGPVQHKGFRISETPGELIWLTGVEMDATDLAGNSLGSEENLCHAEVKTAYETAAWHEQNRARFGGRRILPPKWFTLIQGRFSIEFPPGFGIPMYSDEPMSTLIMALNLDPDREPFRMRVETRLAYVRDDELTVPMRALTKTGFNAMVVASHAGHDHASHHDGEHGGESCALDADDFAVGGEPQLPVSRPVPGGRTGTLQGEEASAHFFVPPGRHVFRNRYRLAAIHPREGKQIRVHYIAGHLHVYGESIELRDATENRSIFKSVATPNDRYTGLVDMSHYSSVEGMELHRDHEYDLITIYDNTTDREVDAMGILYLYYENTLYADPRGA